MYFIIWSCYIHDSWYCHHFIYLLDSSRYKTQYYCFHWIYEKTVRSSALTHHLRFISRRAATSTLIFCSKVSPSLGSSSWAASLCSLRDYLKSQYVVVPAKASIYMSQGCCFTSLQFDWYHHIFQLENWSSKVNKMPLSIHAVEWRRWNLNPFWAGFRACT